VAAPAASVRDNDHSFEMRGASRPIPSDPALSGKCEAAEGARAGRVVRRAFIRSSTMRRFVIERDIPKVGSFEREQLKAASAKSNAVLAQLAPNIQWVHSYVAGEKTFCIYMAKDEAVIRQHAEMSGFPANRITEVKKMFDPTTAMAG
jgi:hypothetical protein